VDGQGDFTWATFSGKTTFQSPEMESPEGNYTFIAYVEDHGDSGDRFWLQVKDRDGVVVWELSMADPAEDVAIVIDGDIVVPGSVKGAAYDGDQNAHALSAPEGHRSAVYLPLITAGEPGFAPAEESTQESGSVKAQSVAEHRFHVLLPSVVGP
jgi:hypothetical protein